MNKLPDVYVSSSRKLCDAARYGDVKAARWLLEHGTDVNEHNGSALVSAVTYNNIKMVKLLLKYGADVHANGDFALFCAVDNGNVEIFKLLLKHGADAGKITGSELRSIINKGFYAVAIALVEQPNFNYAAAYSRFQHMTREEAAQDILVKAVVAELDPEEEEDPYLT